MPSVTVIAVFAAALTFMLAGTAFIVAKSLTRPSPETALVITGAQRTRVRFGPTVVIPLLERVDQMALVPHVVVIERRGRDGLLLRDSIRVDLRAVFTLKVNRTADDVLRVAQSIGCERASQLDTVESLFGSKLNEALKLVAKQVELEQLMGGLEAFRDQVINVVGSDLNGFVLDDLAIDECELTPIRELDPFNVLDAEGIRRLIERRKISVTAARLALERLEDAELSDIGESMS